MCILVFHKGIPGLQGPIGEPGASGCNGTDVILYEIYETFACLQDGHTGYNNS